MLQTVQYSQLQLITDIGGEILTWTNIIIFLISHDVLTE